VPGLVLQGGRRRRRVSSLVWLLVPALLAGGGLGARQLLSGGSGPGVAIAAKPKPTPRPHAPKQALVAVRPRAPRPAASPAALLTVRSPLLRAHRPIGAQAGILIDAASGTVLWERRPHHRLPIASTTKILTAVLALERLHPYSIVTVAPSVPRVVPFREGLRAGEQVEAWKLFYGLLLYSGNDDALALAIATAGSRGAFLREMNAEARTLGMRDSHFTSPSGVVDRGNYSTAWDLAVLARYAMRNPRFRAVVRTRLKRVPWAAPTYGKVYVNHNHLLGSFLGADGIKTGWTTLAKHCLVASATRDGVRLIAVVLASPNADKDARRLLTMGFSSRG
jgi:D-alanyl-D-alanine carboxypeptidase (penicillin-binding protein 5/6)